uniref:Helicase ATP-binding domain-containing protein n=1 Tax=Panagrolaimus sp. JU765 TaxID=591449 RepID=A0AC34QTT5_9BILA
MDDYSLSDGRQPSRFEIFSSNAQKTLEMERVAEVKQTTLYGHQIEALLRTRDYFNDSERKTNVGLIQVPTGGGKSGIISLLPYVLQSQKVMVLSPGKVITNQLEKTFGGGNSQTSFYVKVGFVKEAPTLRKFTPITHTIRSAGKIFDMANYELVIINAQKFARGAKPEIILNGEHDRIPADIFDDFDTIIVDEAHHYPAKTWFDIIEIFNDRKIIFLTATPNPEVAKKNLPIKKIYEISRDELENLRVIRKVQFESLDFIKDINNVTNDELEQLAFNMAAKLKGQDDVVENVHHKAMVLTMKAKRYAKDMAKFFNNISGLQLKATFCTSDPEGMINLANFNKKDGNIRIMMVCQKLTEGYDNSDVSMCVILRNIGSDILFNQFVGRCIRVSHDRGNLAVDDVKAVIYGPQGMWERYERNATTDPEDVDDDDE